MKKIVSLIFVLVFVCGCSNQEVLECNYSGKIDENTSIESNYTIYYEGKYVTKLKTKEVINSQDSSLLEEYESSIKEIYKPLNKIDYYSNSITIEDNSLISSTTINYEKIDMDKLVKVDSSLKDLIKNGKVELIDLKEAYMKQGITCQ